VAGDAIAGTRQVFALGHESLVVGSRCCGQAGKKPAGEKDWQL
jgi:hypothetical protein